jgi:hypothetical protein
MERLRIELRRESDDLFFRDAARADFYRLAYLKILEIPLQLRHVTSIDIRLMLLS